MDPFLASIVVFGCNFAPRGFLLCAGQILAISQNTALFSLIGTYYGGNGTSNFGLPDLRGRTPIQQGQSPGTSQYVLGEVTGNNQVTLLNSNMAAHNHLVNVYNQYNVTNAASSPGGAFLSEGPKKGGIGAKTPFLYNAGPPNTTLNPQSIGLNASSQLPVDITQPYLALTFAIATTGVFPSRN